MGSLSSNRARLRSCQVRQQSQHPAHGVLTLLFVAQAIRINNSLTIPATAVLYAIYLPAVPLKALQAELFGISHTHDIMELYIYGDEQGSIWGASAVVGWRRAEYAAGAIAACAWYDDEDSAQKRVYYVSDGVLREMTWTESD